VSFPPFHSPLHLTDALYRGGTSIYALWKEFDKHSGIGGACGEITVDTGRSCSNLLNPLVAGQNFEYKMSNILGALFSLVFTFRKWLIPTL
jgi:chitin synthase